MYLWGFCGTEGNNWCKRNLRLVILEEKLNLTSVVGRHPSAHKKLRRFDLFSEMWVKVYFFHYNVIAYAEMGVAISQYTFSFQLLIG